MKMALLITGVCGASALIAIAAQDREFAPGGRDGGHR